MRGKQIKGKVKTWKSNVNEMNNDGTTNVNEKKGK